MALPMQSITLSSHAILAPSFATTLSFDVAANCEWQIFVTGNDDGWAELSQVSATGTATVSVMVDENTTELFIIVVMVYYLYERPQRSGPWPNVMQM